MDPAKSEKQLALKKLIAIALLFIFLLQCSMRTLTVLSFYMHRDYISRNLCENRDKPQMHCNGSCCLKKELKKQEKNEQQLPATLKAADVFYFNEAKISVASPAEKIITHHSPYLLKAFISFPGKVFRPPLFI